MVNLRRFGLLLGALALALIVLGVRLYEVQVAEHRVWAREAANLMRSWSIEPHRRGRITDREGRVWVRDEEVYELDFVWRDFRRGHPLGQVAQMRSMVELRSVPLAEVHGELVPNALDLVRLSPAEIDAFGRGDALRFGDVEVPEIGAETGRARRRRARLERRDTRAAELHWYVLELLGPSRDERRALRDAEGGALWTLPYVDLLARDREVDRESLETALRKRLQASLVRLSELAAEIDAGTALSLEASATASSPFVRLLQLLEAKRRAVEFAAADDLFSEAAGFPAQRLDAGNLASIDLEWLRRALYWDRDRLGEWILDRGQDWPAAVERALAGHVIARAKVEPSWASAGDRILSSLACLFAAEGSTQPGSARPVPWWQLDELVVLAEVPRRFERTSTLPRALFGKALPFQDRERRAAREASEDLALVEAVCRDTPGLPPPPEGTVGTSSLAYTAYRLVQAARQVRPTWDPAHEEPVEAVLLYWDALLQERVRTLFEHLPGGVALRETRVREALETRSYVVRDRESRPLRFERMPTYDLVHLVTRHPEHYAGFHVRSATRRVPVAVVDPSARYPIMIAEYLIGRTRAPYLVDLFEQDPEEEALRETQRQLEIDSEQREWITDTVQRTRRPDEEMGSAGIEGYHDEELRGMDGYRETVGLAERRRGGDPLHVPPIDGHDLTLTLDLELQRAAEEVLADPDPAPDDEERPDRVWRRFPVGAVVLMTTDGEVLVAASTPNEPGEVGPFQNGQRRVAIDRTLRIPTFQPPGSLMKPLIAAWSLENGLLTPGTEFECWTRDGDPSAFGSHRAGAKVHCLASPGHGPIALDAALSRSCNAYFAGLGERLDAAGFRALAHTFGLDQPTGVRLFGARYGLTEDYRAGLVFRDEAAVATAPMRQRLANGLSHVNATPVQFARAFAGLATGTLPEVRLVKRIGDADVPVQGRRLPIADAHLETVRSALEDVVISGTADDAHLGPDELGFHLACKTGSADIGKGKVPIDPRAPLSWDEADWEDGERKHAWLAGWFPAERPEVVIVVFCHDVSTTASHVATHVARQVLTHPVVAEWIDEEGLR